MRKILFVLFASAILAGVSGCLRSQVVCDDEPCVQSCGRLARCWAPCDGDGRRCRDRGRGDSAMQPQQPPMAAITYPYYTLRGPRDFLERTPTPIGP